MQNATTHKLSLRKNDQIQVISGREKGKTGKILKVDAKNMRITIEKVNMVKRHLKPSQQYPQGGIVEKELPLHYSNVLLMCAKCNRGVRHGFKAAAASTKASKEKGKAGKTVPAKKIRVCKRCGESLETA
jgi:large subunit ribosomal protein L24